MTTRLGKLKDNSGNVLYTQTSANKVVNTPYGDITATDVQTAIQELDTKKQATLVSATNIKSINGNSLLGSGDLSVSGANIDGSNMTLSALATTAKKNISTLSFPKGTYDSISLGASGSTYTAPADGWYCLRWFDGNINMTNSTGLGFENQSNSGAYITGNLPVKKNDVVTIAYSNGSADFFRFYYANNS